MIPSIYDTNITSQVKQLQAQQPTTILASTSSLSSAINNASGITATKTVIADLNIRYAEAGGIEIGIPRAEGGRIGVIDLSGIHKLLPRVNGRITCIAPVSHSLGLLLIDGVTHINIDSGGKIDIIMNKYLGTRDILSAQDELLEAGYREHARL